MKLQINVRGSWRDVIEFHALAQRGVREATIDLAKAAQVAASCDGNPPSWRISADSRSAIAYLDTPYSQWRAA